GRRRGKALDDGGALEAGEVRCLEHLAFEAELAGDGGGGAALIAGEDEGADAGAAGAVDRLGGAFAQRIAQADEAEEGVAGWFGGGFVVGATPGEGEDAQAGCGELIVAGAEVRIGG